ncbi:hypothetical protein DXT99_14060 [Pontibacter diazotrophicus]|uniref:Lipoprotein n=1 Tax=Pontibacter diazotrophicus TaxID=1400979 RepID=A0A3D8LAR0_9BACT|nr:hypothetical protein [Pontibacter diazotrophicus]RDV14521.1 hypothetical protein DXT99_14060 [Pontibacter diazotrophicus]
MYKLKQLLILCLIAGALVSCGKETDPEPVSTAEQDYLPTTKGSTWEYGGISPYTLTATGETKVINGKTFHVMETTEGTEKRKSYLLKEKGVYTGIGMHPELGDVEIAILKEETPIGKPWEQTNTINGVETKMTLSIVAKGVSKTVEGKTYQNVINVKMETSYIFMGIEIDSDVTTNYYFAKGVGIILSDFGAMGQVPLLTYDVK